MTNTNTTKPAAHPTPVGVVAHLSFEDATKVVAFYQQAFGAEVVASMPAADGKRIMHCHLRINGGDLFLNDAFPEHGYPFKPQQGFVLHLAVTDVNEWWKRAIAAGCTSLLEPHVAFWGDTYAQLRDSFGITWSLSSPAR